MATGGPPDKLNAKHRFAALLLASGKYTMGQVAKEVGMSQSRLSVVKSGEAFKRLVEEYQERFLAKAADQLQENVMADGPNTFDFLRMTRDGEWNDSEKMMNIRLKAGIALWDRQVPKRDDSEAGGVTIVINNEVADRLRKAELEVAEFED